MGGADSGDPKAEVKEASFGAGHLRHRSPAGPLPSRAARAIQPLGWHLVSSAVSWDHCPGSSIRSQEP